VVPAAPRLDSRLVAAVVRDARRRPIAETCRRAGDLAWRLGLVRPSYETIRRLVHAARRRLRYPSTAEVLLDVALRIRPPTGLGDHLAGTLPPRPRPKPP
jgi:hypothetical protein